MSDIIILGCGVIGAAVSFCLSRYDVNVVVLEKENDVSMKTSRANSAIIHAGYDPAPGTLMAKLNVEGSRMAEFLARDLSVPYKKNGSLVLAFDEEDMKTIKKLCDNGIKNGVEGVKILGKEEVSKLEPNVSKDIVGALFAPTGAIINPWEYALAMAEVAVENGVKLKLCCEVKDIEKTDFGYSVKTNNGDFEAKCVINCTGVDSDNIHNFVAEKSFRILPSKGQYYLLDKDAGNIVSHTIFQCPKKEGKGVLVSPTVHGNLIAGPNAEEAEKDDVSTSAAGLEFVKANAQKSVPNINFRSSIRNFAGVRANSDRNDFIIDFADENFLDIAGIKSPGLSAAPAIALYAIEKLKESGLRLEEKKNYKTTREKIRFKELSAEKKNELIKKNPLYGRVICRCETITEGEIVDCIKSPIPPVSVDGVKRRVNAGMGRCQGGFCGPRVVEILSRELGVKMTDIVKDKTESFILTEGDSDK